MNRLLTYTIAAVGGVVLLGILAWLMFFRSTATLQPTAQEGFPTTANQSNVPISQNAADATNQAQQVSVSIDQTKKVFKVAEGPVAAAVLLQAGHPTSTVARYIMADTGRVFEVPLDSAGALARVVSNTTIPGLSRALWAGPNALIGQYIDAGVIKTLYLGFPTAATASTSSRQAGSALAGAVRIQFLPDGLADVAVSPDGASVAYTLKTTSGVTGYVAKVDGTGSKRLFSLPLAQILLSWPSTNTLLAQSPAAVDVAGIVFSIDAKTGVVSPLLYGSGLSATADRAFGAVIYQTTDAGSRNTYLHSTKTNNDTRLSFDPFPENCSWSPVASTSLAMFCFLPLAYTTPGYIDLWRFGVAAAQDSIFLFDVARGRSSIVATPGSSDGGDAATIANIAISPDNKYLLYVTKGDRGLWGVRLQPW